MKHQTLLMLNNRFSRACRMEMKVNRGDITRHLRAWQENLNRNPLAIRFVETVPELKQVSAQAEQVWQTLETVQPGTEPQKFGQTWYSQGCMHEWRMWLLWSGGKMESDIPMSESEPWSVHLRRPEEASKALTAWGHKKSYHAWQIAFSIATLLIEAKFDIKSPLNLQDWIPILQAFEAGAWVAFFTHDTMWVITRPDIICLDENCHLHREDGAAFSMLNGEINLFFHHGVCVNERVIHETETIE